MPVEQMQEVISDTRLEQLKTHNDIARTMKEKE